MPSRYFDARSQFATSYLPALGASVNPASHPPDLLFSFVGSRSHRCRANLLGIRHPRAEIDDASGFVFYDASSPTYLARRHHFTEVLHRSKFVLCPRGQGTSSIRLYETLAAGRVPVVLSDQWVPPTGPSWKEFALLPPQRISTRDLVALLEAKEHDIRR